MENNCIGIGASDRKGIAHNSPLRLSECGQQLSQIMDKSSQNQPSWMPISTKRLSGLKKVIPLRKIQIWIAFIYKSIKDTECFPYPHFLVLQGEIFFFFSQYKFNSLIGVIGVVKIFYVLRACLIVDAILFLAFGIRGIFRTVCNDDC